MNTWTFFASTYSLIAAPLVAALNTLLPNVISYVRTPLLAGLAFWIAAQAAMAANGFITLKSVYRTLCSAAVILTVLQSMTTYNQYVVLLAQSIPREAGAALAGGGVNVADGGAHDLIWNQAAKAGLMVWEHIPSYSFKGALLTLCVAAYFVVAIASIAGGFGVYLVTDILMTLLLVVGPFFVALYPFSGLRKFFMGWFSALVSAIVTMILSVAILALLVAGEAATVQKIIQNAGNGADANFVSELLVLLEAGTLMYLLYSLIKQIPSISTAIAGGVYQNVSRVAGAPMSVVSAGAQMAGSAASRGIGAAAGKAASSVAARRTASSSGKSLSGETT